MRLDTLPWNADGVTFGRPQPPGYVERWTPTRWIPAEADPRPRFGRWHQVCCRCFEHIHRAKPGNEKGDRGTRAWFEPRLWLYLCTSCAADEWPDARATADP